MDSDKVDSLAESDGLGKEGFTRSLPSKSTLDLDNSYQKHTIAYELRDASTWQNSKSHLTASPPPRQGSSARSIDEAAIPNQQDPYLVRWESDDAENPLNWGTGYKSWLTFQIGMLSLAASLGTAITSPASNNITNDLGISHETVILNVSLYLLGFGFGPVIWAPTSEVWGRRISLVPPMVMLSLFSVGVGASNSPSSLFICRFFSGVFGSAPVSNVGAALGDIWSAQARGTATAIYALAVVGGPTVGPVLGSVITESLGWRWTGYVLALWVLTFTLLTAALYPETYAPVLLKRRAAKRRRDTGDPRWRHPHEDVRLDARSILVRHLGRPVRMLLTEPIIAALSCYAAFVYALQFVSLEVFPYIYGDLRGWQPIAASLPFLALFVGEFGTMAVSLGNQGAVARAIAANGGRPAPDARIPPMILGGFTFVASLFWFGWTAAPSVPWPSSVVAAVGLGAGFDIIFQQSINVLVDIYQQHAASAVSSSTLLRSLMAAGLPLAARPMVRNLGVGPAMSILGGVAALALPVPFLLLRYGPALRKKSKFAEHN